MNEQEFSQQYYLYYNSNDADTAFQVYLNSLLNDNSYCLLGRMGALDDIVGTLPIGRQILVMSDMSTANFFVTDNTQSGNVLRQVNPVWTIGINDAWLLGGIHGRSIFNFAGEVRWNNNINDLLDYLHVYIQGDDRHPITITGREILGLKGAGYIPHIVSGTLLFSPPSNIQETHNFDFVEYHQVLSQYSQNLVDIIADYLFNVFQ